MNFSKVSEVISNGGWDLSEVERWLLPEEVDAVKRVPLPLFPTVDSLVWQHDRRGIYSVKSGYRFGKELVVKECNDNAGAGSSCPPEKKNWKWIWGCCGPPRVKQFIWRACRNVVASKDVLFRRKCSNNPTCPICGIFAETIEHVLLLCDWAKQVWFCGPLALKFDEVNISTFHDWCENMLTVVFKGDNFAYCCLVLTCWHIWKSRCDFLFNGVDVDPVKVGMKIKFISIAFVEANGDVRSADVINDDCVQVVNCWKPPSNLQVKINVDGAFSSSSLLAGWGVIIRNCDGAVLDGANGSFPASSAFMAEAFALRKGVVMAIALDISSVIFELDCKVLVDCVNIGDAAPWECQALVDDIRLSLLSFSSADVVMLVEV